MSYRFSFRGCCDEDLKHWGDVYIHSSIVTGYHPLTTDSMLSDSFALMVTDGRVDWVNDTQWSTDLQGLTQLANSRRVMHARIFPRADGTSVWCAAFPTSRTADLAGFEYGAWGAPHRPPNGFNVLVASPGGVPQGRFSYGRPGGVDIYGRHSPIGAVAVDANTSDKKKYKSTFHGMTVTSSGDMVSAWWSNWDTTQTPVYDISDAHEAELSWAKSWLLDLFQDYTPTVVTSGEVDDPSVPPSPGHSIVYGFLGHVGFHWYGIQLGSLADEVRFGNIVHATGYNPYHYAAVTPGEVYYGGAIDPLTRRTGVNQQRQWLQGRDDKHNVKWEVALPVGVPTYEGVMVRPPIVPTWEEERTYEISLTGEQTTRPEHWDFSRASPGMALGRYRGMTGAGHVYGTYRSLENGLDGTIRDSRTKIEAGKNGDIILLMPTNVPGNWGTVPPSSTPDTFKNVFCYNGGSLKWMTNPFDYCCYLGLAHLDETSDKFQSFVAHEELTEGMLKRDLELSGLRAWDYSNVWFNAYWRHEPDSGTIRSMDTKDFQIPKPYDMRVDSGGNPWVLVSHENENGWGVGVTLYKLSGSSGGKIWKRTLTTTVSDANYPMVPDRAGAMFMVIDGGLQKISADGSVEWAWNGTMVSEHLGWGGNSRNSLANADGFHIESVSADNTKLWGHGWTFVPGVPHGYGSTEYRAMWLDVSEPVNTQSARGVVFDDGTGRDPNAAALNYVTVVAAHPGEPAPFG